MISNALASGLQGVRDGTLGMQNAANRIVENGTTQAPPGAGNGVANGGDEPVRSGPSETGGLAEPIVDLKLNQRGVEASIEVVKTADETLGTLLDEQA